MAKAVKFDTSFNFGSNTKKPKAGGKKAGTGKGKGKARGRRGGGYGS